MQLRNYQEQIVLAVIPLVLQDHPEVAVDETLVHDVAAYVLNRLPPRYIMSERGLTRIVAEQWLLDPDDDGDGRRGAKPALIGLVELLLLVNKAIQVVHGRRSSGRKRSPRRRGSRPAAAIDLEAGYWHNFPQVIGRVLDARRRTPVVGATVTLSAGSLGLLRTERGWSNPCVTQGETGGYYSLWPRALRNGDETKTVTLRLAFDHPDYEPASAACRYRSRGDLVPGDEIRLDRVINFGTQLLVPRGRR